LGDTYASHSLLVFTHAEDFTDTNVAEEIIKLASSQDYKVLTDFFLENEEKEIIDKCTATKPKGDEMYNVLQNLTNCRVTFTGGLDEHSLRLISVDKVTPMAENVVQLRDKIIEKILKIGSKDPLDLPPSVTKIYSKALESLKERILNQEQIEREERERGEREQREREQRERERREREKEQKEREERERGERERREREQRERERRERELREIEQREGGCSVQ